MVEAPERKDTFLPTNGSNVLVRQALIVCYQGALDFLSVYNRETQIDFRFGCSPC